MEKMNIAARQSRLAHIIEEIAHSYDDAKPKIHHLDRMPLPSREDAAAIMEALEEVIYPGYYSSGGVTHQGIIYRVQERIGWLFEHLRDQISRGLRHMKTLDGDLCLAPNDVAEECAYMFLERLPTIRRMLAEDIQAAYDGDPAARIPRRTAGGLAGQPCPAVGARALEIDRDMPSGAALPVDQGGGRVVAAGPPEKVAARRSHTAKALKAFLESRAPTL